MPNFYDWLQLNDWTTWFAVDFTILLFLGYSYFNRNAPRIGGKIGRRSRDAPAIAVPAGFSRAQVRALTTFAPPNDAAGYKNLKAYLRHAPIRQSGLVYIYRVPRSYTRVEIPSDLPEDARPDPAGALALLRELPDSRLVYRLHFSAAPSFIEPWARRDRGLDKMVILGNATQNGLIVLYHFDRASCAHLPGTLIHEWLHILAYKAWWTIWRFKRANKIEALPPLPIAPTYLTNSKSPTYEDWATLGEMLLGYDEEAFRQTALAFPVHATILWRRVEKVMRKAPKRFASTRLAEFEARGAFMRTEVTPRAKAARRKRPRLSA
jgi:hypothetical protein